MIEQKLDNHGYTIIDPLDYCIWRETYVENRNGIGTSFADAQRKDLECVLCDGFEKNCSKYLDQRVKR